VEEPRATEIRESELARDEAIEQARAYLEGHGWHHLDFVSAAWEDHPQGGDAFYIYFTGSAPGKPSFVQALGGVDCVHFVPAFSGHERTRRDEHAGQKRRGWLLARGLLRRR
jgi:hypothetical protein